MNRGDIVNNFIKKLNYKTYLEIGYGNGHTFHRIQLPLENKIGVDGGNGTPGGDLFVTRMTSDEFFELNKIELNKKFDIIFIDGSHLCEDVEKDMINSLQCLNEGGTIVMHDCNPENIYFQERTQSPFVSGWMGDTWKAFVKFRSTRSDLEMYVVDTDCGCGVIRLGKQDPLEIKKDLIYGNLETNRKKWLNLITIEEFNNKIKNHEE